MGPIFLWKEINFCCAAQIKGCGKGGAASEEDLPVEVPKVATDKELKKEKVDIKKEYCVVKVVEASEEDKPIESIMEEDTEISKVDA